MIIYIVWFIIYDLFLHNCIYNRRITMKAWNGWCDLYHLTCKCVCVGLGERRLCTSDDLCMNMIALHTYKECIYCVYPNLCIWVKLSIRTRIILIYAFFCQRDEWVFQSSVAYVASGHAAIKRSFGKLSWGQLCHIYVICWLWLWIG